ncbi:flavin reductase family protein [Amorphus sp. 3PC139-8]|uniref:flavin reductase family protein n=1 Tax=Amorphus sp. 3PC139-8 TaxID=2735676 RepID=UPI00345C7378
MNSSAEPTISTENAESFRRIWRGFGSTVALIATELDGRRHAMLATAVNSVSMNPPSLLVCINRSASAYQAMVERGAFSLGILPADAHGLGAHMARASGAERFSKGDWRHYHAEGSILDGLPWLAEAQATLFCRTDCSFDYGTHTIHIGIVQAVTEARHSDPLLYCEGRYGHFVEMGA